MRKRPRAVFLFPRAIFRAPGDADVVSTLLLQSFFRAVPAPVLSRAPRERKCRIEKSSDECLSRTQTRQRQPVGRKANSERPLLPPSRSRRRLPCPTVEETSFVPFWLLGASFIFFSLCFCKGPYRRRCTLDDVPLIPTRCATAGSRREWTCATVGEDHWNFFADALLVVLFRDQGLVGRGARCCTGDCLAWLLHAEVGEMIVFPSVRHRGSRSWRIDRNSGSRVCQVADLIL